MTAGAGRIAFVKASTWTQPDCFVVDRGPGAPLLVTIHGISRNAAEIAARFANDQRFAAFTIVAPLFDKRRFGQYQQLIASRGRVPSDLALFDLVAALAGEFGFDAERFRLFGFSGGAQMAHRIALLHPKRIVSVCAVAAGWYTMPDRERAYPYGLADELRFGAVSDGFLAVPITVAVGEFDRRIDASVRQSDVINSRQGRNRLARARAWTRAMKELADLNGLQPKTRLVKLRGGAHEFGQCVRDAGLMDVAAIALCGSAAGPATGRTAIRGIE
jgi:poly(3-hydroxybutyrate) depolymerase